ncbi:LysR family transcriptional regulator [Comamonadaceae bacterium PP-2]
MDRSDLLLVSSLKSRGSLAAAAAELGVTASVASKRLARLEAELGVRLFLRTTRRLAATPEGERLVEGATRLLSGFEALEQAVHDQHTTPVGTLRLAATFGFGRLWLGPALADFQQRHPGVAIQLQLTEKLPDLASEGYDAAIWLWSPRADRSHEWSARRLAPNRRVLVASPAYLAARGTPTSLDDLAGHECLVVRENQQFDTWTLQSVDREGQPLPGSVPRAARVKGALSSNSGELVRDWCLAGRGIMLRSLWDVAHHLRDGTLHPVLPDLAMLDADIHWLAPFRVQAPRRSTLLAEFLRDRFESLPWRDGLGA